VKAFDRFLLFLYSLVFFILSLGIFLVGIEFFKFRMISNLTYLVYSNDSIKWTVTTVSLITFLFSVYFMVKSFQTRKVHSFFHQHAIHGEIRISMETLENIAAKVVSKVNGIKDLKVKVRPEENETVTALIKIYVDGETPIPQISEEIQEKVKDRIEHIAGIKVNQIHIVVSNTSQSLGKKARVE